MIKSKLFMVLDIDGVLLESHGYREACIDTINDFIRQMGQPGITVDRSIPDAYEAAGISAEWDMIPLTLAVLANRIYELGGTTPDTASFLPYYEGDLILTNESFSDLVLKQIPVYASLLDSSKTVMDAIADAFKNGNCEGLKTLYKNENGMRFFVDTLDPWKCPFFAQLMNRLLGSKKFTEFYGLEAPINVASYLETKDRRLISEHFRQLLPKIAGNEVFPAIMTYRPTLYPVTDRNKSSSYFVNTPEGECALQLLDWTDGRIPMIGGGSLCYIEEKYGLRREHYVKPHPFHALTTVILAACKDEIMALELARTLCESEPMIDPNPIRDLIPENESLVLSVFEDSISGIESVRGAVQILRRWGYNAKEKLCGICSTPAKNTRLQHTGATLFSDVNAAFDVVLREYQ